MFILMNRALFTFRFWHRPIAKARIYSTIHPVKKQDLAKCGLPETPGVYFFRDKDGNILYIGKATSLQDRVKSYFSADLIKTRGLKVVTMVTIAETVTYQSTDSVLEALLLENVLIKKHNPIYNTKEKDNRSYVCVVITKEEFPRVLLTRVREFEKKFKKSEVSAVYGPFASGTQLRSALKIIRKLFPFRDTCIPSKEQLAGGKIKIPKPCFNAQIHLCPGVCTGAISSTEYKKNIANIKRFFEGKKEDIKRSLEKDMKDAAKSEHFERAANIRNTLFALEHIKDTSLITDDTILSFKKTDFRIEAYDVAHISGSHRVGVMTVIEGGEKNTDEYRKFKLEEKVNDDYEGLRQVLRRRLAHTEWRYPDLIVIDGGLAHKQTAEAVLAEAGVLIPTVSVVKDERHKPKDILGRKEHVDYHKKEILLANSEAHRSAITYHKLLRNKL
jgi:excinuclease ABC subunit C